MNDSNGRFGDKKEWRLLSVLCSLWGIYARENLQYVFISNLNCIELIEMTHHRTYKQCALLAQLLLDDILVDGPGLNVLIQNL